MKANVVDRWKARQGAVVAVFAILLALFLGMVAFAIDIGYVSSVKSELQRSADAAALAAAGKLLDFDALRSEPNDYDERTAARLDAHAIAAANPAARSAVSVLDGDIQIGYVADPAAPAAMLFDQPANAARVHLRRDENANGPISLWFARALGLSQQPVYARATAIFEGGVRGFRVTTGSGNASLLPYTLKDADWDDAFADGPDEWTVDPLTGAVSPGPDGIREVKLFPHTTGKKGGVTPGNFGTVDIGNPNNSTADLARQILHGPNASDLAYYPNSTLALGEDGTLLLNGDTGISAGVKDELESIKGQPRTIPLYSSVSGNGNNAQFTIVRFVGMRILDVKLTGSLSNKSITIQPAYVADKTAVRGGEEGVSSEFVRIPLRLIE